LETKQTNVESLDLAEFDSINDDASRQLGC